MDDLLYYNEEEEWNRALLLYDSVLKEITTKLEILNNEFKLSKKYNPIEHISSRIKSGESIARKIRKKNMELTVENIVKYVNDVAGVRIICSFTSDIYQIADAIMKQNDVTVLRIKDYIANPKPNGYRSYHMIVSIPIFLSNDCIDTKVEIQIRTIAMDFWASLEHKMYYKFYGKAPETIREELTECANIIAFLDSKMLSINERIQNYNEATTVNPDYISDDGIIKSADYKGSASVIDEDSSYMDSSNPEEASAAINLGTVYNELTEALTMTSSHAFASTDSYDNMTYVSQNIGSNVKVTNNARNVDTTDDHIPEELRGLYGSVT
ncbi:MAG: GTP pyrophosphokinase family protein [Lachnospiraceae bacterium]|nr:GTP pyrophosphokinase family protein [Lachnospiraceae bacterium]